jgi:hypothetical protein
VCSFTANWSESLTLSALPASIDEMIAARVDGLKPELQQLLRMCAVFGRTVDLRCIRQLWRGFHRRQGDAAFDGLCQELVSARLLLPPHDAAGDHSPRSAAAVSYVFAQASMVDVIYHRMPFSLRCRLHLSITRWYECTFAAQLQPFYSRLAYHTASSARYSAVKYLHLAGQQAIEQHAKKEAIASLRQCLAVIDTLPDAASLRWKREKLHVMALYAPTYVNVIGTPLGVDVFAQLWALSQEVQNLTAEARESLQFEDEAAAARLCLVETFYSLRGYYFSLVSCNLLTEARSLTPRVLSIAESIGDLLLLQHAWHLLSVEHAQAGRISDSLALAQHIMASQEKQQRENPQLYTVNPLAPMDPVVWSMTTATTMHALRGEFRQSVHFGHASLELAEEHAEPVAYQQSVFHHCYASWTLELPATAVDGYWANVRRSKYQMVSLLPMALAVTVQVPARVFGLLRSRIC